MDRRRFLRGLGVGGALIGGGALLSACGVSARAASERGTELTGELIIPDRPLSFDPSVLTQFTEEFGVPVRLAAGEGIGRDLVVLNDQVAGRMIDSGSLSELNRESIPNASRLMAPLGAVSFDPERAYSLPWRSGLTGLAYDRAALGRDITSVSDLFADDLHGRVTVLGEMRDTMGLVMAMLGIDPLDHEFSEYERAVERLRQAVDSGQVRPSAGSEYADDLANGTIAACIARSADLVRLQFADPEIQFIVPDEGGLLWSDNMLIPANAENQPAAEAFMNFVYRPEIAAQIASEATFITPVQGARDAMVEIDERLAESQLIFPNAETLARTFDFKMLDEDEEQEYDNLFQSVVGGP